MNTKIFAMLGLSLAVALFCGPEVAAQEVDGEGFPVPTDEPPPPLVEETAAESLSASLTPGMVDLRLWTVESYPPVAGFPGAVWDVDPNSGKVARERNNAQPTLLYSDFSALWTALEVRVRVQIDEDDDYIGLAVGFQPWDTSNASAEYLLVDWKKNDQPSDFGSPSCTPGSTAYRGLAVSRVFGVPTADEFWGHVNFDTPACSDLSNGLQELVRGDTLGADPWDHWTWYHLRAEYTPTSLKVYVNGTLEIDITGTFGDGRWAFYDFSQQMPVFYLPRVEWLTREVDIDIKPGSDPNAVNINGNGVIPVAILGSEDFDVTQIDVTTLEFAGLEVRVKGNGRPQCSVKDVSGDFSGGPEGAPDGYPDLVCQFVDDPDTWTPGDGTATLTAELLGGTPIEGSDCIRVVSE